MRSKTRVIKMIAIYCRTSLDVNENKVSRKVQLDEVLKTLKNQGITEPYEVFEEIASAKDIRHRPVLRSVLEDIQGSKYTQFWSMSLDRISRKLVDLLYIFEVCKENNVLVNTVKEPLDQQNLMMRDLQIQMIGAVREYQRETIGEYLEIANKVKSEKGLWLNGSAPYGYSYSKGKVTVVKSEAKVVKKIFELYIAGMGYQKIASYLNESGIQYRKQKSFERYHICNILKNEKYVGKIVNRFGEFNGQHEAIISDHMFNKAKKIRETKRNTYRKKIDYLGLTCICPHCGRRLSQVQKNENRYYYCSSEQLTNAHERYYVNATSLENEVKNALLDWIGQKDRLAKMKHDYQQKFVEFDSRNRNKLRYLESQKEAIYTKYYQDKVTVEELALTIEKLDKEIVSIEHNENLKQMELSSSQEVLRELAENIQNYFSENDWVNLVDKVELTTEKEVSEIYAHGIPLLDKSNSQFILFSKI